MATKTKETKAQTNGHIPTVEVTVTERIGLLSILPKEGDILTLRIVRDLIDALSFSEQEIREAKMVSNEKGITWDASKQDTLTKNVPMGEKATDIVKDALKAISQKKKLAIQWIPIYERFVGDE